MEPRGAAGATEPGRARGSIGRSCRRHARGSIPLGEASATEGVPERGQEPWTPSVRQRRNSSIVAPQIRR